MDYLTNYLFRVWDEKDKLNVTHIFEVFGIYQYQTIKICPADNVKPSRYVLLTMSKHQDMSV